MVAHFTGTESTFAYFAATRQYLERYGKPLAFYSDKASIFRVNLKSATGGVGHTQFGRALYELNIDGICANTPAAKGRVERAHLTLQDRLVKELRLQGISTIEAANAFMPAFMADYSERFAKAPRNDHDAHRAIRADENLDLIFTWRELRKVTQDLTLHYERKLYLLPDIATHRRLIGRYIDVFQYPDGRVELRAANAVLPYCTYDKLGAIDQGEIVENKRLGQVLRAAQIVQAQRDSRRVAAPSTAHRANGIKVPRLRLPGTKSQRSPHVTCATPSTAWRHRSEIRLPGKRSTRGASTAKAPGGQINLASTWTSELSRDITPYGRSRPAVYSGSCDPYRPARIASATFSCDSSQRSLFRFWAS